MRKLRALEDVLVRVESALAVVLVLTMLLLAAYNVVYRNVLVPLQQHWAHSGPPVERMVATTPPTKDEAPADAKAEPLDSAQKGGADDFGGFGGGLGEEGEAGKAAADDFGGFGGDLDDDADEDAAPEAKTVAPEAKAAADDFGGFGGGLDDEPERASPPPAKAPQEIARAEPAKAADDFGGFGGGLDEPDDAAAPEAKAAAPASDDFGGFGGLDDDGGGGEAKAAAAGEAEDELDEDELGEDDLGDDDPFANLADIDAVAKQTADAIPQGGPPPPGSFAAWAVAFIDDIKLDWIDVFLRQLVIIVAFFGAMLATQRGKHINVDALSKLLPSPARRVVSVILPLTAVAVCLVLARAGWDLVRIGREYPKDLLPSVPEWSLQLMFPVGFGLLALHFVVRVVEAAVAPPKPEPPPRQGAASAADVAADAAEDVDDGGDAPQEGGR